MDKCDQLSPIGSFYQDKCILITGATGFLGKVIIEKLLRSCPTLKRIYVLIRPKKELSCQERLSHLLESKLFDVIRQNLLIIQDKLIAIDGDITIDNLGISTSNLNILINEIDVVIHSAATIRFEEPLKVAILYNLVGTANVLALCHSLLKIKALVHVSTAYSTCIRKDIDELVYEMPHNPKHLIEAIKWMSDEMIAKISKDIIGAWPNTYTFTKALAERLLANECGSLPIAIVRPSIVTATWQEPFPGWVDNLAGPGGILVAMGKGFLRTLLIKADCKGDLIPVDIVAKMIIVAGWHTSCNKPSNVTVFNCKSDTSNQKCWGGLTKISLEYVKQYPTNDIFRYPSCTFTCSPLVNKLLVFADQYVPAYLCDAGLMKVGRKRVMVNTVRRMQRLVNSQVYFQNNDWNFKTNKSISLMRSLRNVDQINFSLDVKTLQWSTYWADYILGIREYVFKEDPSTLPMARKKLAQRLFKTQVIRNVLLIMSLSYLAKHKGFIGIVQYGYLMILIYVYRILM